MAKDIPDDILIKLLKKSFDEHVLNIEISNKYRQKSEKLTTYYIRIRELSPENDLKFISELEHCFTDMITMHSERLYVQGYRDGRKSKEIFKKLFAWFKWITG
jgi:hypothetical protein